MAQLVKLYDYISRYESNPFHYPSQYIRLKQENWNKLIVRWENEPTERMIKAESQQKPSKKFKWPFKRNHHVEEKETESLSRELPETKNQLKQYFLNQLYPVQLKWATSTITYTSFTKVDLKDTETMKYFLQRFPDIYLLMYYPIFNIKNAPIDGEIILISPFDIEIIHLFDEDTDATIIATDDRKWTIETMNSERTILSPSIALKRTEQIIRQILQAHDIAMPTKKSIISESNHIVYTTEPYQTNIIGKRNYTSWFKTKRNLQSSLKSIQLKAMEALLNQCQTTAVRRPEWKNEYHDVTENDV